MVTAFQIILLILIALSAIVAFGDTDKDRQLNVSLLAMSGIAGFIASVIWL